MWLYWRVLFLERIISFLLYTIEGMCCYNVWDLVQLQLIAPEAKYTTSNNNNNRLFRF